MGFYASVSVARVVMDLQARNGSVGDEKGKSNKGMRHKESDRLTGAATRQRLCGDMQAAPQVRQFDKATAVRQIILGLSWRDPPDATCANASPLIRIPT